MNLLPKSDEKFAEKEYWDDFFKNRNKSFEWYGEYPELCSYLHKYIKPKDDVLVVGCGNSDISANMYDVGYRKIQNIDISSIAIRQMKQLNKNRKEMTFEEMDALNTTFAENTFSAVIDKGTLDALMPQDSDADLIRGQKLINEMSRILKLGGRYLVVSLLQKHILKTLLEESSKLGWMVRICRCHEVEQKTMEEVGQVRMPVFIAICTKLKKFDKMPSVLEIGLGSDDAFYRTSDPREVIKAISEVQESKAMCNIIQKKVLKQELEMEFRRQGDKAARYTIRIVDAEKYASRTPKYGVLIVPHGRETEWMFGTVEGRKLVRESSGCDRLALVSLHRDNEYPSLEAIQVELSASVTQLAPPGCLGQIPYLAIGSGLGERKTIYTGNSKLSGDFVVEDIVTDDQHFRRLIFLNNQSVIQSEARLKNVTKNGKSDLVVDSDYVACDYHFYMTLAVALQKKKLCSVLVLGLGGGALCTFILKHFPKSDITAVDIDPAIVDVAKQYFGLPDSNHLHVEVCDGLQFLDTCNKNQLKFDVIMIDVDSKSENLPMSCPPADFLSDVTLDAYVSILSDSGVLAINVVCRVDSVREEVIERIRTKFGLVAQYKLTEDVNDIILASCQKKGIDSEWKDALKSSARLVHQLSSKTKDNGLDLEDFLKNLIIL